MEEETSEGAAKASNRRGSFGARLGVATSPERLVIPESYMVCWNDPLATVWSRLEATMYILGAKVKKEVTR